MFQLARLGLPLVALLLFSACGYTEQEMAAKQREIDALTAQVKAQRSAAAPTCPTKAPVAAMSQTRAFAAR
jgi:hypothetical protein